jgi:glycosyltransferase involved in cell wall biosynthesis
MNAHQPLVSIIMPAYNAARFIGEAIDSVLAQTYPHWELIIIDDASSDGTEAIVGAYADPRIHYQKVARIGHPSGVRNVGLRQAKGEFITFLDADDLYFPDTLEKLANVLLKHPECIAVYGFASNIDEYGQPLPSFISLFPKKNPKPGEARYLPNPDYSHSWENIVTSRISCLLSALMLRRSTLDRVGLLNEDLYSAEDYEFYVRLFLHDYENVRCIPDYAYRYRIHSNSLTKTPAHCEKVLNSCLKIMRWLFEEAPLPAEVKGYRSRAYTCCYHYLARERLLNGQPQLTRQILRKAFAEQHIQFSDFIQLCLPLWLRSWLPLRLDQLLVYLRRQVRLFKITLKAAKQGAPNG